MGALAKTGQVATSAGLTPTQVDQFIGTPILQVPREWRGHVNNFYMCWASVLREDGMLTLCARLRNWAEQGAVLEDLLPAFVRLVHPAVMGKYKFPSDLLADLGAWVHDARRSREAREEVARLKNQGTIAAGEAAKVRAMLSELFKNPDSFINRTYDDDEIVSPLPPPKADGKGGGKPR